MKGEKGKGVPKFRSLEEEREYWEARGPLAEGRKGRINKPKSAQKRSSFLAVRLTGEELTRLRDIAAKQGLGSSTFARTVLISAIEHYGEPSKSITLQELMASVQKNLTQSEIDKFESLVKNVAIGDLNSPLLLAFAGNEWAYEEITFLLLRALLAIWGVRVVSSEQNVGQKPTDVNAFNNALAIRMLSEQKRSGESCSL